MNKKIIINRLEKVIFGATIISNIKVKAIEKYYQLKDISFKLDHIYKTL